MFWLPVFWMVVYKLQSTTRKLNRDYILSFLQKLFLSFHSSQLLIQCICAKLTPSTHIKSVRISYELHLMAQYLHYWTCDSFLAPSFLTAQWWTAQRLSNHNAFSRTFLAQDEVPGNWTLISGEYFASTSCFFASTHIYNWRSEGQRLTNLRCLNCILSLAVA